MGITTTLAVTIMAGETGGTGRDLPLRAPLAPFPGGDQGVPIYNENGPIFLSFNCFSTFTIVALVFFFAL